MEYDELQEFYKSYELNVYLFVVWLENKNLTTI